MSILPRPYASDDTVILVARRFATYDDEPGRWYHFPRRLYESKIRSALGQLVLLYEPERGGTSSSSRSGGRKAFFAWAILGELQPDPRSDEHAYVTYAHYRELPVTVPPSLVGFNAKLLQSAVFPVPASTVEAVLQHGMAPLLGATEATYGLVDRSIPWAAEGRMFREVVRDEVVRDRTFRYKVIEQAYRGRCVMTGMALTNGKGRAEVDAAHIKPVSEGGPDIVSNGLALTKTVHWAFDRGLVSAADDGRILVVERGMPDDLRRLLRPQGTLAPPERPQYAPHNKFLAWHREHVFKGIASR